MQTWKKTSFVHNQGFSPDIFTPKKCVNLPKNASFTKNKGQHGTDPWSTKSWVVQFASWASHETVMWQSWYSLEAVMRQLWDSHETVMRQSTTLLHLEALQSVQSIQLDDQWGHSSSNRVAMAFSLRRRPWQKTTLNCQNFQKSSQKCPKKC